MLDLDTSKLDTLISSEELQARVAELGAQISKDYEGKELVVLCILKEVKKELLKQSFENLKALVH